ncbi:MAG: patatin-like phospholipase family protein [Chromatiales bacterium]
MHRITTVTADSSYNVLYGLALSGGGLRAAAFHCGALRALQDINHVDEINALSAVSGGSLFGAAWMAAQEDGTSQKTFSGTCVKN